MLDAPHTQPREALDLATSPITVRRLRGDEVYAVIEWDDDDTHEIGCILAEGEATSNDPSDAGVPCWEVVEIAFVNFRLEQMMTPELAQMLLGFWRGKTSLDHFKAHVEDYDAYDHVYGCIVSEDDFGLLANIAPAEAA